MKSSKKFLMVDISQSVSRARFSAAEDGVHVAPTMMPEQIVWVNGRLLLGREALLLQGFPIQKVLDLVDETNEAHLRYMAGNSFGFVVVLALLMATFAAVDWADSGTTVMPSDEAEQAVAMSALASLGGGAIATAGLKRFRKST